MPPSAQGTAGSKQPRLPKLPAPVKMKLDKTAKTRGATKEEIYQNRVARANTVLIPWDFWDRCKPDESSISPYEQGFIVLVEPAWYFTTPDADDQLRSEGVELGRNALLLFHKRSDWVEHGTLTHLPNGKPFRAARSRTAPLGGVYLARVHATTAREKGGVVIKGFDSTSLRGAGIRVYEYASAEMTRLAKLQMEALLWMCEDSIKEMVAAGMPRGDATTRRDIQMAAADAEGLLDLERLVATRTISAETQATTCPLCMHHMSAADFTSRTRQAEGRETYDLTTTDTSMFHIDELRVGQLQHKPYNLGWGHHLCNVAVADRGIATTLDWMRDLLSNQGPSTLEWMRGVLASQAA